MKKVAESESHKGDVVWIIVVICAIFFMITSIPKRNALKALDSQINSIRYQTNTLTVVKPDIKVFNKIDTSKAEAKATKEMTDNINWYVGNVHSQVDYDKNIKKFKNVPGNSVMTYLNKSRIGEGTDKWIDISNPQVQLAFGKIKDPAHADAYLVISYQGVIPGKSDGNKPTTVNNYWHLDYNLYTQKVNSAKLSVLADTAEDAR